MCCDDKFLFFMKVRTGSLIFAWIGAVLSGLGTLGCFIANMVFAIFIVSMPWSEWSFRFNIAFYVLTSTLLVYFGSGFIASVLLLIGIIQRKPTLIKGYIIYGMVLAVLYILLVIILESVTYVYVVCRIFEIFGFLIYCAILYLHFLTFKDANISNTNGYVVPPQEV